MNHELILILHLISKLSEDTVDKLCVINNDIISVSCYGVRCGECLLGGRRSKIITVIGKIHE